MKRYVMMGLGVALVATMMSAGGCVSRDEYDRVNAMNRNAQQEIGNLSDTLRALKAQNADFERQLKLAQAGNNADLLKQLQDENDRLKKQIDALTAQLNKAGGEELTPLPDDLNRALAELAKKYGWYYDAKTGMVRLPSDLTFDKGSAVVNANATKALGELAGIFNTREAMPYNVFIAGHTDDIPIKSAATKEMHPNNWYLSVHRAVSVEEVLQKAGLAENRMAAMGFGEWRPIAPNAPGKRGNQLNRRVELWVLPKDRFQAVTSPTAPAAPETPVPSDTPES